MIFIKFLRYASLVLMFVVVFLFVAFIIPIEKKYPSNEGSESVSNKPDSSYENPIELQYESISQKVIPYIVNARITIDDKTLVGEVIQDKGNGKEYCIEIDNEEKWYSKYYVSIIDVAELTLDKLTNEEIEFYINYNEFDSETNYFIWVDIYRNETYVLKKENGFFFLEKRLACSTGANITPTKRGLYTILDKGTHFYSRDNTYICYNYLKYSGSYLLHSFPYSLDKKVLDDRLYERVSNGCVRYTFEDSLYLYNDIPINSTIWLN